jgi:hypothetical protein
VIKHHCVGLQDLFNIVAVDDFNMGAMENKSLNIFNSRLVLADPDSSTDGDYARIEGVVGHEYFHNWTGARCDGVKVKWGLLPGHMQAGGTSTNGLPGCCSC